MSEPVVGICVPSFDQLHADFWFDFSGMLIWTLTKNEIPLSIGMHNHRLSVLPVVRNRLVRDAINSGATHVLFLDSDMRFPPDTLLRLLSHDKDIVAANCVLRAFPTRATAWADGAHVFTDAGMDGLQEVDSIGTAVMLIKTDVFRKMPKPWFYFQPRPEDPNEALGEDQYFCAKAKECGFKVHIDHGLSHSVAHVGTLAYTHAMAQTCRDNVPVFLSRLNLNTSTSAPAVVKG